MDKSESPGGPHDNFAVIHFHEHHLTFDFFHFSYYHSFPSAVMSIVILCKDYGYVSIIFVLFSPDQTVPSSEKWGLVLITNCRSSDRC